MKTVEPIRNLNQIAKIKGNLLKQKNPRDLLLFVLSINTGLRISDALKLKLSDVKDKKGDPRDYICITEQKTHKQRKIPFNSEVRRVLQIFFTKSKKYDLDSFLFTSDRGTKNKPLSKVRVWQLINSWCRAVGILGKVGCHTLRKTLGYQMRKKGIAIEVIQEMLGHSSVGVTSKYIGINKSELEQVAKEFTL